MKTLGIVPAAGRAERFGGTIKELLPYGDESLLRRTIRVLKTGGADQIVILTNPEKVHMHVQDTHSIGKLCYVIQQGDALLDGIMSITLEADRYLFAMPDTLLPEKCFGYISGRDSFYLGLFNTIEGHRFGVWQGTYLDNQIDDKRPEHKGEDCQAWGVVAWPKAAMYLWRKNNYTDHTEAFNHAIKTFGAETGEIDYYHDIADFEEYKNALSAV